MIAIIDYGMGNLRSVQKAFEHEGAKAVITQNPSHIKRADKVVLPGVGAMDPAMKKLSELGLTDLLKKIADSSKPFLGICLGLQLLFESSQEGGSVEGLGVLSGSVQGFQKVKVPQIGWNQISLAKRSCPLFRGINEGSYVYFCHSYYVEPKEQSIVASRTEYGTTFASTVWKDNLFGVQFHPEKSQSVGLSILKNFSKL